MVHLLAYYNGERVVTWCGISAHKSGNTPWSIDMGIATCVYCLQEAAKFADKMFCRDDRACSHDHS
jgi:hypothetical protein